MCAPGAGAMLRLASQAGQTYDQSVVKLAEGARRREERGWQIGE